MSNVPIKRFLHILISVAIAISAFNASAQNKKASKPKKKQPPFKWVNPIKGKASEGVEHHTFVSPSMKHDVGYCIYLPPAYKEQPDRTFPVVYYLHGGRPGSETKSISLAPLIHANITKGDVAPMIYVFVNGGAVSHYNYPEKNSMGEDVFVKELIPHIDKTWRTIAKREARGLEGFSQGGRGTTRIMFKHPKLFSSCAPGGAGHATEKRISEENGKESEHLTFAPEYNTYDLARVYAKNPEPPINILVHVGNKGFNYENNLAYMEFLKTLKIKHDHIIADGAPHSAKIIFQKEGLNIMKFHEKNFMKANGKW